MTDEQIEDELEHDASVDADDLDDGLEQTDAAPDDSGDESMDDTESRIHETLARARGWKPKSEWKGDATNWRDAKTFNLDFEANNGKLRKEIKAERERADKRVAEVEKMLKTQKRAFQILIERERKKLEAERADLRAQMEAAVDSGDTDAWRRLKAREDALAQESIPELQSEQHDTYNPHADPAFHQWIERNSWYRMNPQTGLREDPEKSAYAESIGQQLSISGMSPERNGIDFYNRISEEVEKRFSRKSSGRTPPRVETGRQAAQRGNTGGNGWMDIPKEERQSIMKAFADTPGIVDSKEARAAYAKAYFEEKRI